MSRPSAPALYASATTGVLPSGPRPRPVPHLGTRGSHKRVASESWDVVFSRPPPSRPIPRRRVLLPTSPAGSLLSDSSCARCSFAKPPIAVPVLEPQPTGAPTRTVPSAQGPCESDRSETRRACRLTLLSREYFLNALIPATESGLSVPLFKLRSPCASADSLSLP